jgi:hypothetical protein
MKAFITTLLLLTSLIGYTQFNYTGMYKSEPLNGKTSYFRVYNDGLVIMVTTTDEVAKVQGYFNREGGDVSVYKVQSNIKDGNRASFTVEIDGQKQNYIAVSTGETVSITRMGPGATKEIVEYKLVK